MLFLWSLFGSFLSFGIYCRGFRSDWLLLRWSCWFCSLFVIGAFGRNSLSSFFWSFRALLFSCTSLTLFLLFRFLSLFLIFIEIVGSIVRSFYLLPFDLFIRVRYAFKVFSSVLKCSFLSLTIFGHGNSEGNRTVITSFLLVMDFRIV